MLGDGGVLRYKDAKEEEAKIDRFLSGVWLSHLTQLRAQLAALQEGSPAVLSRDADHRRQGEAHGTTCLDSRR